MVARCRNCGVLDHRTQVCPRYGPWYPEPGKTVADYAKLQDEITRLVAGDILAEHEPDEGELVLSRRAPGMPKSVQEREARTVHCDVDLGGCGALPGQPCVASSGRRSDKSHAARRKQVTA